MGKEIKEVINYCLADKDELYDREMRRLYLNCDIDESIIDGFVYMIMKYNREDKGIPIEKRKPIIIYINTPGGSVSSGYSLIDIVMASHTPVYTVNQGTCYSMGFLIFLAGEKRYSMKNSTFLLHEGSSVAIGSSAKLRDRIDFESEQMEKHIKEYVTTRTNISEDLYNKQYRKEWYMYSEEAKSYGIVTHIVGEDCNIYEIL